MLQQAAQALGSNEVDELEALQRAISATVQGKDQVIRYALIAALSGGHLLLEDVPGVGKTTLALAMATALGCRFSRIQFTSDLLPTDVLGMYAMSSMGEQFEFRPGPIFANLILADEINRTTPKTQSCLLEAMGDVHITLDGQTHALPQPFMVIATQNPIEHAGTFPLPESQLDRFQMRLKVGYPDQEAERLILRGIQRPDPTQDDVVLNPERLIGLQKQVEAVRVAAPVEDYILALVNQTRRHRDILLGVSPRGARALYRATQAAAFLSGRTYALPDDVKEVAIPVLAHRLKLAGSGHYVTPTEDAEAMVATLLAEIAIPE